MNVGTRIGSNRSLVFCALAFYGVARLYAIVNRTKESGTTSTVDKRTSVQSILPKCDVLTKWLIKMELKGKERISSLTACPNSDAWLENYLESYANQSSHGENPFVFLNFGCNKGYDSLRVAEAVTHNQDIFDKTKWAQALAIDQAGACGQDLPQPRKHYSNHDNFSRSVEVHCVEAMPSTFQHLDDAAKTTTANQHGLHIHNYALTGTPGGVPILFPEIGPGNEAFGIQHCEDPKFRSQCVLVSTLTVDEFVAKHVDLDETAAKNSRIPYVSIDLEGLDYTVMKAAQQTLRRTNYLEFEFHDVGDWAKQNLKDAIDMLYDLGFYCFWAGKNQLWRITDCWVDVYGSFHAWSNIACVNPEHQPALAEQMESVFLATW